MSRSGSVSRVHPFGMDYSYFCTKVAELTGINLHNYKSKQMHRRLTNYMQRYGIPDFPPLPCG